MSIILKSTAPAYGGYSLGKIGSKIVFVEGMIPGETAEVEIMEERKDFSFGKAAVILEPSPHRRVPRCPIFGICGGCHLQYVSPEHQVFLKDQVLADSLRRIGKLEIDPGIPVAGAEWEYRHRVQFKISSDGSLGFYQKGTRDVTEVPECPVLRREINLILDRLQKNGALRGPGEAHITLGDTPVALVKGAPENSDIAAVFHHAGIPWVVMENGSPGEPYRTTFRMQGLSYSVSPRTFIQSHWALNCLVVEIVMSSIRKSKARHVLDLYAGAGNFSIPAALSAERVTAVEGSPGAVADGMRNLELNGIGNCRFIVSPAERYTWKEDHDLIILDPPRAGLPGALAEKIVKSRAEKLIYISCNPSTLARDIKKLDQAYGVSSVRQIDFFPQTFHIEAMAFLELR